MTHIAAFAALISGKTQPPPLKITGTPEPGAKPDDFTHKGKGEMFIGGVPIGSVKFECEYVKPKGEKDLPPGMLPGCIDVSGHHEQPLYVCSQCGAGCHHSPGVPCAGCGFVHMPATPHMLVDAELSEENVADFMSGEAHIEGKVDIEPETVDQLLWRAMQEQTWVGAALRLPSMRERLLRHERAFANDTAIEIEKARLLPNDSLEQRLAISAGNFLLDLSDEVGYQLNSMAVRNVS